MHIDDVVNLIRCEELSDVVLCGHSYGGCVISGVADSIPDRIGALVYLDAFVLENGQSLHDTLPPDVKNRQLEGAQRDGEGWKVPPIPAEVFKVNAQDAAWVSRQCTMQPLATSTQRIQLSGRMNAVKNVTYIQAAGWDLSTFQPHFERAKAKGWKTLTMPCGHDVMLDLPQELTHALIDAAPRAVASTV